MAGAPGYDINTGNYSGAGAAYVFVGAPAGWASMTQTAKLTESAGQAGDAFGTSVAIAGNTVVVTATAFSQDTDSGGLARPMCSSGAANGWTNMTPTATLTPSDGIQGDDFGFSTAISANGSLIAVGADYATGIGANPNQGITYV